MSERKETADSFGLFARNCFAAFCQRHGPVRPTCRGGFVLRSCDGVVPRPSRSSGGEPNFPRVGFGPPKRHRSVSEARCAMTGALISLRIPKLVRFVFCVL